MARASSGIEVSHQSQSSGLIAGLKEHHDRLLRSLSQQLEDRESQLLAEIASLQRENLELRDQLQGQEAEYLATIDRLKEDAAVREGSLRRDAEATVKALEERLERLTATLIAEQAARQQLDQEIVEARMVDQKEIEAIYARNQEIQREFEVIKAKGIQTLEQENEALKAELLAARESVYAMEEELSARERKESGLIRELEKLQSTGNRELTSLKEVIQANKRALEVQNEDLLHLRKAKDDAKAEVRRLQMVQAENQQELELLRNRYSALQQQYTRLDSLVRGRRNTP